MDLARDLIDHLIVDCDDQDSGMVDDLWIERDGASASLGPLVTGSAALIAQLGFLSGPVARAGAALRLRHAAVWREIGWQQIERVERPQTRLLLGRAELSLLPGPESPKPGALLFTQLSQLPVVTADGHRLGLLDIRTEQHTGTPPTVLGLIASPQRGHSFALKRYASTAPRFGGIAHRALFVPWSQIASLSADAITTSAPLEALQPLVCAPDPGPPPMPKATESP
jgi:hypothetical protein